jgi:hypothetical protein
MKTTMKIFLEWLENSSDVKNDILNWEIVKGNVLEFEKMMIIDAVNTTERKAVDFCNAEVLDIWKVKDLFDVVPDAGIDYYNEKFKDNE